MKIIDVHQVDAFTNQIFGGNPAGVVTNADALTTVEMQKIAREMNLSETAFVLQSSSDQADVRLRFFTPSDEVKFCGHATVGTLFQLAKLDMFGLGKDGKNDVRVETGVGVLSMAVTDSDGGPKITFTAPEVKMMPYHLQGKTFAKEFGIQGNFIKADCTILLDKNLNYLYIPVASLKALGEQTFDFSRIRQNFAEEQIVVFCFFSNETMDGHSDLHARGLAPNIGVDEDPFTGSMQAGLMHAAMQNSYIDSNKQRIITEQGHFVGRPGFAEVNHSVNTNEISVTASAVHVFSTKMEI